MKKRHITYVGIIILMISCTSKENVSNEEEQEVDLKNLTFCDCKNNRFDIKGEIQREKDPKVKKDLEAELAIFDGSCKKYDLKPGATAQEIEAYQLDWNKKAAECR